MSQIKILGFAVKLIIFVMLLTIGCTRPAEKPAQTDAEPQKTAAAGTDEQKSTVKLALKFAPGDSTAYRVITENDKSVEWESPDSEKPRGFTGGHTGNKTEITFMQQIQSTDDKGNAVAKITIKQLKYLTIIKNEAVTQFDSTIGNDRDNPLSKMIGQNYTIEITPSGRVLRIIDVNDARTAVASGRAGNEIASSLLSDKAIRQRHTIPTLPDKDKNQLRKGETWSSIESFSFDMMGSKSYEKIYTLEEIKDVDNHRIAIARMNAVPSAEDAKKLHEEQSASLFANMSDNTQTYTGELRLDLANGKIEECREKLISEWVIVNPNPKEDEPPAVLKMAAVRSYSIEKID